MTKYDYAFLRDNAESGKADDVNALGAWFELYGSRYWNGEYFDADGMRLFPVTVYDEDDDFFAVVGYEIR